MTDRQTDPASTLYAPKKKSIEDRVAAVEDAILELRRVAELHHGTLAEIQSVVAKLTASAGDEALIRRLKDLIAAAQADGAK